MDLFYSSYIKFGIFTAIIFFLLRYCYNAWKIYSKFPILHLVSILIDYHLARNVPKDISFNGFLFQNLITKCQQFSKEGIVMCYILRPVFMILSEEAMKVFLNEKIAGHKPAEYKTVEMLFGPGLISSNGARWKKHRKMLNPSFQLGILKERVPLFNEHASALMKDLETLADRPQSDPLYFIKCHYFSALSESVFGLKQFEESKATNQNYFHMIYNLSSMAVYMHVHPWLKWKFVYRFTSFGRHFLAVKKELMAFTKNVITEMEKLSSSNETRNSEYFGKNMEKSLTYILLKHHLNDPSFTFEDLHAEVTTFMAAGYDTVSYSTLWCLFMLGLYPEVQEKAFNEVNSLQQDYISYEESCNFTYLESVIMETLRLYPTVPFIGRDTTEDVRIGKYFVPKGSHMSFFSYVLHRDPDIYPDPEKFIPERFINGGARNPWIHIPFAEGNRTCIGKKYALIEMKIFLAYILRNFKIISLDKREDVVLCWNIVLTPEKPLRIKIERRYK